MLPAKNNDVCEMPFVEIEFSICTFHGWMFPTPSHLSLSLLLLSLLLLLLYENHKQEHEAIQNDVDKDWEM